MSDSCLSTEVGVRTSITRAVYLTLPFLAGVWCRTITRVYGYVHMIGAKPDMVCQAIISTLLASLDVCDRLSAS